MLREVIAAITMSLLGMVSGRLCPMPDTSYLKGRPPGYVYGIVWPILYGLLGIIGSNLWKVPDVVSRVLFVFMVAFTLAWPSVISCPKGMSTKQQHTRWAIGFVMIGLMLLTGTMLLVSMLVFGQHGYVVLAIIPYIVWLLMACLLNYDLLKFSSNQ
jgi:tryptophan-rich sensory protein